MISFANNITFQIQFNKHFPVKNMKVDTTSEISDKLFNLTNLTQYRKIL